MEPRDTTQGSAWPQDTDAREPEAAGREDAVRRDPAVFAASGPVKAPDWTAGTRIDHDTLRTALKKGVPYVVPNGDGTFTDLAATDTAGYDLRRRMDLSHLEPEEEESLAAGQSRIVGQGDTGELDWKNPVFITRDQAKKARQREAEGVLLELPYTGGFARVKLLEMADKASLAWVPTHLREKLANVMALVEGKDRGGKKLSPVEAFESLQKQAEDVEELANAFCIRGFLKPTLVPDDVDPGDDPYTLNVSDLHINERISYLNGCIPKERQGRVLDPFRGRPISSLPDK